MKTLNNKVFNLGRNSPEILKRNKGNNTIKHKGDPHMRTMPNNKYTGGYFSSTQYESVSAVRAIQKDPGKSEDEAIKYPGEITANKYTN